MVSTAGKVELAEAVMAKLSGRPGVRFAVLVPNLKGTQRALACDVQELRYSIVTTQTYNKLNWNMSIDESLEQVRQSVALVRQDGRRLRVTGVVSCAFGCPYAGDRAAVQVMRLVQAFVDIGMDGVILADSAGMGNPNQIQAITAQVRERWANLEITMHFHNTRAMGLANVLACLQIGINRFDASIGGLGGCPFSPEAAGNICTLDTAYMLAEMGISTGLDVDRLMTAAGLAEKLVGHQLPGMVYRAGKRMGFVPLASLEGS